MRKGAYYNEWDAYAAQWLRNLIAAGHIAPGDVDERSIVDVRADDLVGYDQCHFFAGIGGWSAAARLAGWPDTRPLWTGSPPCQPFSVAGRGKAQADERHLWPEQFRLIRARRPAVWMGEQVAAAVGKHWLDGVLADLEGIHYAGRAVVVPACAVDAPHRRERAWIVADANDSRSQGFYGHVIRAAQGRSEQDGPVAAPSVLDGTKCSVMANAHDSERGANSAEWHINYWPQTGRNQGASDTCVGGGGAVADAHHERCAGQHALLREEEAGRNAGRFSEAAGGRAGGFWDSASWIIGHDGKARRVEPGIPLLAHGIQARVGRLRAYGNAIVPQVAAEIIAAYMECAP